MMLSWNIVLGSEGEFAQKVTVANEMIIKMTLTEIIKTVVMLGEIFFFNGKIKIPTPIIMMTELKIRHNAQVNGIRSLLSAEAVIILSAASVWNASIAPEQMSATPITGREYSRVTL